MKKEILVSIIIVNYNNAKYLEKSIKSAFNQEYKNKEIIVVDDNSKDNSLKILKKYNNLKLIKLKNKKTYGSLDQINAYFKGFIKSKGKIIFFLDSDDYFAKNKINLIVKLFKKEIKTNIIFDLPVLKFKKNLVKKKFVQKKFIFSKWPRFTPQSCISVRRKYAQELFLNLKVKKFYFIWFDFRIAIYSFLKDKNIYIYKKYLTYYRQLDNSASKKFKTFSKNWWLRRNEAHDFFEYLQKKINTKKTNFSLDKIITKFVNKIN